MSQVADEMRRNMRETLDNVLQFPNNLGAHSMLLIFKKYQFIKAGERRLNKVDATTFTSSGVRGATKSILLPLPQNIEDTFNIQITPFNQSFTGQEMAASAASIAEKGGKLSAAQIVSAITASLPKADIDSVSNAETASNARDAAFLMRKTFEKSNPDWSRNLDTGFGSVINPKQALYFEGVTLKRHTFQWNLAPQSSSESDVLREIGNTIKRNILPSYEDVTGFSRILLNYPSTLDIFFLGVEQSYLVHFKTCMVEMFSMNFTPNGLAFVKGGKPAMVSMNMNVIESDIHTSEDYGDAGSISL